MKKCGNCLFLILNEFFISSLVRHPFLINRLIDYSGIDEE